MADVTKIAVNVPAERQAELRAAYDRNITKGYPPYCAVRITSRDELDWVKAERGWDQIGMGADLTRADLTDATLTGATLTRATLTGATLTRATLTGANLTRATLTRADLRGATLRGADLTGATLTGATLTRADLRGATLTGADLTGADLTDADLTGADLTDADLTGADLTGATLTGAELTDATLTGATLTDATNYAAALAPIRNDLWAKCLAVPHEVGGLLAALIAGRIEGNVYQGDCACFVGTIANLRGCNYRQIAKLPPDCNSPTERWFLAIHQGDTPETNVIARITAGWLEEFVAVWQQGHQTTVTPA